MDEGRAYRIESFDPLLRDLVEWGLATRVETDGPASWQLSEHAQSRLNEIIRPVGPLALERLVYLDHLCADCHFRGRTRLHEGLYLCDECREQRLTEIPEPEPVGKRWPWRRHRDELKSESEGSASVSAES